MTTVFTRILNPRNVSHLSRLVTTQSAFLSTEATRNSSILVALPKYFIPRHGHRRFCTETNKPKQLSFLEQIKEEEEKAKKNEDKKAEEERQRQWKTMKLGFVLMGGSLGLAGSILIHEMSKPNYDENGNMLEDEFSNLPFFEQRFKRFWQALNYFRKLVQDPSRDKLLPDPLKPPYIQPPYTIVLELRDLLIHPDWTFPYQTGWRFKKRPGVDKFLESVGPPQFETVVYTAEQGMTVFPILDILDPEGFIMWRLVRDSTRFINGHHVKDLDSLNRDLSKVIVIDWNEESVKFHQDNLLKLPRWNGNDDDTTLYDLSAFLKTIYASNVEDVREVLKYYRQFENPLQTFRENQRKLLDQLEEQESLAQLQKEKKFSGTDWSPSFLKNKIL